MSLTIISRKKGETHATKIVLNYNDLRAKRTTDEFQIPDECLPDGGGIEPYGTRVILSELLHEPTKNKPETCPSDRRPLCSDKAGGLRD